MVNPGFQAGQGGLQHKSLLAGQGGFRPCHFGAQGLKNLEFVVSRPVLQKPDQLGFQRLDVDGGRRAGGNRLGRLSDPEDNATRLAPYFHVRKCQSGQGGQGQKRCRERSFPGQAQLREKLPQGWTAFVRVNEEMPGNGYVIRGPELAESVEIEIPLLRAWRAILKVRLQGLLLLSGQVTQQSPGNQVAKVGTVYAHFNASHSGRAATQGPQRSRFTGTRVPGALSKSRERRKAGTSQCSKAPGWPTRSLQR